jgi:Flp pilus assembly protein TadG
LQLKALLKREIGINTAWRKKMNDQSDLHGQDNAPKRSLSRAASSTEPGAERRSRGRRLLNLLRRGEHGSSLVETALVLSLVVLPLTTGILVFGVAMNNYLELTNAVSLGARAMALNGGITLDPCAVAVNAIEAAAPALNPANLTFSFTLNGNAESGTSCSASTVTTAPASYLASGTQASVTVTYPLNLSIFGTRFSASNQVLQATSTELVQ